eukprot:gnl/MRDRNA2_/MRDRNA2_131210_c0_seq1.p1 gnl/MRDRNA2_/MRDRNA2_131210_c0~~gnl/MRDRNA2_/MRDRNA2_131210_c0_seq1.p1  ORF type:complete len:828 (+),score=151.33 gnl/MRDRNA2_/MRDRNA2_131210_c0_seq1:79-2562(+)
MDQPIMYSIVVVVFLTFACKIHAAALTGNDIMKTPAATLTGAGTADVQNIVDKMVRRTLDKPLKARPLHSTDLETSTVRKAFPVRSGSASAHLHSHGASKWIASNPLIPKGQHSVHRADYNLRVHPIKAVSYRETKRDHILQGPALPEIYNQKASASYFATKPVSVVNRALEIVRESASFAAGIAADSALNQTLSPEEARAKAAKFRSVLERLGPTFVKFGQAASIRVDLLPDAYIRELRSLQDAVPPFSSDQAKAIIDEELDHHGGMSAVFSELSEEPLASASLGQVYQGILKTGEKVAVKVQRPGVLEGIQLDLYLLRQLAPGVKKRNKLNTDLPGLVDEWGTGFVNELDYRSEARKAKEFNRAMEQQGLDTVIAPEPFENITTRRVLVTKWIDGERLEESPAEDVARLCGIALTAYLTMLLDTGCLHADPHPGNLMRTADGRLAILDWGLTTAITPQQQYAIVDYIAHLVAEDYDSVPQDLAALGFVPEGKTAAMQDAGVAKTLSFVFRQLAAGGGAKKIAARANVQDIGAQVAEIRNKYGNIFQTPTYFAYILRSFTILEGIGLQNNPDYAIVQNCYPYIAKRLFLGSDARTQQALKAIIYKVGPNGKKQLNAKIFVRLARAFRIYTDQRLTRMESGFAGRYGPETDNQVLRDALMVLLSAEGTTLQKIILKEAVKMGDASMRQTLVKASDSLFGLRTSPLFGSVAQPLDLCFQAAQQLVALNPTLKQTVDYALLPITAEASDEEALLDTLNVLMDAFEPEIRSLIKSNPRQVTTDLRGSLESITPVVQELGPELLPGAAATAFRLNTLMFARVCNRVLKAMG